MRPTEDLRIEYRLVRSLSSYPGNPRTPSKRQNDNIAASNEALCWTNPVLIDCNENCIACQDRLTAAKKLGLREGPVVCLEHLNKAKRSACALADNKRADNVDLALCHLKVETRETVVHANPLESLADMAQFRGRIDV